jgi:hypothetical protein
MSIATRTAVSLRSVGERRDEGGPGEPIETPSAEERNSAGGAAK